MHEMLQALFQRTNTLFQQTIIVCNVQEIDLFEFLKS
jgi:hypothetical protein